MSLQRLALVILLTACSGSAARPAPAPEPRPTPREVAPEPDLAPNDPCRGNDLDIHAIATGALCPLDELTPIDALDASIPKQTRASDFDWITVELQNPGDKPVIAAINPQMAMAIGEGVIGGVEPSSEIGFAVTIEAGGVARLRVPCAGRCLRGPSTGSATLRVMFFAGLGKIVGSPEISGTITVVPSEPPVSGAEPEPVTPHIVSGKTLLSLLISGEKNPPPDPGTVAKLREANRRAIAAYTVCVSYLGVVSSTKKLRSSGYPTYDLIIEATVRDWMFEPFVVGDEAVPFCAPITFIHAPR